MFWFPPAFRQDDGTVGVYFEAGSVIVALILLGQALELLAAAAMSLSSVSVVGNALRLGRAQV